MPKQLEEEIQSLGEELAAWRKLHSAPTPIPTEVWSRAAALALERGVGRISKALRLDYGKLKNLAELSNSVPVPVPKSPEVTFIEFQAGQIESGTQAMSCLIEVEGAHGLMRADMAGASPLELGTIFREFARSL